MCVCLCALVLDKLGEREGEREKEREGVRERERERGGERTMTMIFRHLILMQSEKEFLFGKQSANQHVINL